MSQQFRGPFGLWPFPLINYLLSLTQERSQRAAPIAPVMQTQQPEQSAKGFHNLEKFEIKYDKQTGDPVEIIVHRNVEPNE